MRRFLLIAILSFVGLAAGAQDPPPGDPLPKLTPAEIELIKLYVDLREAEMKPHQEAMNQIWKKYDEIIRSAIPPEKHLSAKALMGGC